MCAAEQPPFTKTKNYVLVVWLVCCLNCDSENTSSRVVTCKPYVREGCRLCRALSCRSLKPPKLKIMWLNPCQLRVPCCDVLRSRFAVRTVRLQTAGLISLACCQVGFGYRSLHMVSPCHVAVVRYCQFSYLAERRVCRVNSLALVDVLAGENF